MALGDRHQLARHVQRRAYVPAKDESTPGPHRAHREHGGHRGASGLSPYVASKHAVLGLADSLRNELRGSPLGVSVLCPGQILTNLSETTRAAAPADVAELIDPELQPKMVGLDPAPVGELVVNGILENRFYLFTHGGRRTDAEARTTEMLAAFDAAPF